MQKHELYLCQKQNGEYEPRYVQLLQDEIEGYKQCIKTILSHDDFEELVEAPVEERSDIVERLLCNKQLGTKQEKL